MDVIGIRSVVCVMAEKQERNVGIVEQRSSLKPSIFKQEGR